MAVNGRCLAPSRLPERLLSDFGATLDLAKRAGQMRSFCHRRPLQLHRRRTIGLDSIDCGPGSTRFWVGWTCPLRMVLCEGRATYKTASRGLLKSGQMGTKVTQFWSSPGQLRPVLWFPHLVERGQNYRAKSGQTHPRVGPNAGIPQTNVGESTKLR